MIYIPHAGIEAGDTVTDDCGFGCMDGGAHTVLQDGRGLYVECDEGDGHHYLEPDDDGRVIGFIGHAKPIRYINSKGVAVDIESMHYPHLLNAAKKLRAAPDDEKQPEALVAMEDRLILLRGQYVATLKATTIDVMATPEEREKAEAELARLAAEDAG